MRSIILLLILVMIGLNGKGQSVTALPDSVLSQCCLEVTLLNGNVTTVDWVFIQYITRDGTGTKLFVEYAPNFGGIQWETQIRIQDDFDEVLERSKFIMLPFTVGSTDYAINRNWIANIEENTTTGGTWIYGRFGTPTKRKFSAVEDYETLKNLLLACRPRAIIVAENGLYTEGDTVRMGGFLIEPTTITTEGYNWQMKDTASTVEFGIDYSTPGSGDTTAYFARRFGVYRQLMAMGRTYWTHRLDDTTGVTDKRGYIINALDSESNPYASIYSRGDNYLSWFLQGSFGNSWTFKDLVINPYYTFSVAMSPYGAVLGASESGTGDPGNGVSVSANGFGIGADEWIGIRTKNVDNGLAHPGQFLQLVDSITGKVEYATLDLSSYLEIGDTAAMLDPYISIAGWGLLKSAAHTLRADSTLLATRLFAKNLPTYITSGQVAYSNGSNLVGSPNHYWNNTDIRLGIGTSAPSHTVDIVKSSGSNYLRVFTNSNASGADSRIRVQSNTNDLVFADFGKFSTGTPFYKIINSGDSYLYNSAPGLAGDMAIFNDNSSGRIKFAGGGRSNPDLIIHNNGNINIGTSATPSYILDINSTDALRLPRGTTAQQPTSAFALLRGNTTTGFIEGNLGSGFENIITSTGASANQIARFSNAGKIVGNANFIFNSSNNSFSVGTPVLADIGSSFLSELAFVAGFYGTVNNGTRSNFKISTATWGRPGATTIDVNGSQIHGYDGFLHFINHNFDGGSVSSSGFYTKKSYLLGQTIGPANVSNLITNSTNVSEYTNGAGYPSGSNFYNTEAVLSSITTSTNTGQAAVRSGVQISGRYLNLKNDQGVVISASNPSTSVPVTSAALNINYSNRGFLPPRGSSHTNISRGIASVTITNGGSGYGTGAGVTISISGGGGSSAAISLTYSGGVVTAGTVLLKGTNYTSAPTITISGGTGTGATATCTLEALPDGLQYYNTTTKTPQYWETTTSAWRDYGSYQSGSLGIQTYTPAQPLHVVGAARITGSAGTATAVMGRDANGDISNLGLSGLSIISGVLTATATADGNGIYGGSGTLSQHTTRALIPSTGNLFFSQKFNANADSAYFNIVNYLSGERAINFGLTDTSSTGYSRGYFESDGAGAMNWTLETNDVYGSTTVRAFEGSLDFIATAGNISLTAPVDQEITMQGLIRAKQEAYYEINSTSSPQLLSNTYPDNYINQGGTQPSFTLEFPASPEDGQILKITFNNAISSLTLDGNGNTIVGSTVTTAVAGSQRVYKFYSGDAVWVRQN